MPSSRFPQNWPMVNLDLLPPFLPMQLCSLIWSCCLGRASRTFAKMEGYSRRLSLKERNGKILRILMKCLLNMWLSLKMASGDEGVVPPNASLQIDLELISWKVVSDINKDKKVLKKTLKEGEGYERPNDGAVVQGGYGFYSV
ncbi:uncharacterized protein LOC107494342 [Arachis duranensis]|uniref:Uncharacterized protein LOC107494342 n=1 Tax=Arachis duranensis TaxID=130453 RepID=A0A9C6T574_ARADU|nr:uncharacterized protein LOC107494342 [Arachis duranensis]XP_052107290.1 uncharacterized protein LOC107494342 [Arachis duranensis]